LTKDIQGHKAYSISDYLAMPNTPQPFLLEGLLYAYGKTVLVGKPKFGKSHLAMRIGRSVALGQPLFNLQTKQAPVLLLEFDRRYLQNSIYEIFEGQPADLMSIIPATGVALNEEEGYRLLLASAREYTLRGENPLLIIIDHKSACFTGKENEDAPNKAWIANLDKVAQHYPVTYLVICQAPKGWKGDIVDLPLGSRIVTAWADTIVSLTKPSRDTQQIDMVSNYGEIDPITYTKDFQIVPPDTSDESKLESAKIAMQEQWDEFKYPNISKKVADIAEKIGVSYSTAWAAYNEVKQLMKTKTA
jgi:RecA-family ATPase